MCWAKGCKAVKAFFFIIIMMYAKPSNHLYDRGIPSVVVSGNAVLHVGRDVRAAQLVVLRAPAAHHNVLHADALHALRFTGV